MLLSLNIISLFFVIFHFSSFQGASAVLQAGEANRKEAERNVAAGGGREAQL